MGAAGDQTEATRLGGAPADQTGVTRVTRRGALTGRGAAAAAGAPVPQAAAPAKPGAPAVQRLQPRAAAERDWPPGTGANSSRPPVLAPAGRGKKRGGAGAIVRGFLVGAVMAAAGAGFGYWASDQVSKTDFTTSGGDLPGIVENLRSQLEQ